MLIEQLSLAYKCHSAIGNSLDKKDMFKNVLKTFVKETYAVCGLVYEIGEDDNLEKFLFTGRKQEFEIKLGKIPQKCKLVKNPNNEEERIMIVPLNGYVIFLVYKNSVLDFEFLNSMFTSLVPKLNISVDSCESIELLKRKNEELLQANKYKNDFFANMSHELKTPLNSIIVISSVMARNSKKDLNEEQVKNIEIINKSGNDLLALINDILDISKMEAGETSLTFEDFNIDSIMNDLIDRFKPLTDKKNIEFKYELDEVGVVYSDSHKIKQIISNLVSNAIKFVDNGFIEMKLKNDGDFFEISVEDNGIGIKEERLKHIFDRFKQADGTTTRKYGGTGLGLSISKELANLLGGDISVSSEVGKGSIFIIRLPKKVEDKNYEKNITIKKEEIVSKVEEKEESIEEDKKEVIVAHTNPIELFNITMGLKKANFTVKHFNNFESIKDAIEDLNIFEGSLLVDNKIENHDRLISISLEKCKDIFILYSDEYKEVNGVRDYLQVNGSVDNIINAINKEKGEENEKVTCSGNHTV